MIAVLLFYISTDDRLLTKDVLLLGVFVIYCIFAPFINDWIWFRSLSVRTETERFAFAWRNSVISPICSQEHTWIGVLHLFKCFIISNILTMIITNQYFFFWLVYPSLCGLACVSLMLAIICRQIFFILWPTLIGFSSSSVFSLG